MLKMNIKVEIYLQLNLYVYILLPRSKEINFWPMEKRFLLKTEVFS